MGVQDLVTVVTGVTSGVGKAVAEEFARQGGVVVGLGRRQELGQELAEQIQASGGRMTFVQGDVKHVADCERLISTAIDEHGRVDVLINNAGTVGSRPIVDSHEATEQWWDDIVDTNLKGTFFCCRYALGPMKAAGRGHIINISSTSGVNPLSRMQAYNASKAAIVHLSRGLAIEYQEHGVRVNSIVLGSVADGEAGRQTRRAITDYLTGSTPPDRKPSSTVKTANEVARFLAALCDADCDVLTGATIALDGGVSAGLLSNKYWLLSSALGK
jgi:NAD(P)-dependent dehydrogenase (short-subunit alcohol dehydrogenase family)